MLPSSTRVLLVATLLLAWAPAAGAQVDRARDDYNFAAGLHDRGLHDRAVRAFTSFLDEWGRDGRAAKAHFYLGQSLVELGRDEDALPHFEAYVASGAKPLRREARFRVGELQHRLGRNEQAVRSLGLLLRDDGLGRLKEPALYTFAESAAAAGNEAAAAQAFKRLLADFGEGEYAGFAALALGFQAFKAGDHGTALEHFAAAARPGRPAEIVLEATVMTGECRLKKGEAKKALAIFRRVLRGGAGSFDSQVRLGVAEALLALKRDDEAVAAFVEVARRCPGDSRSARAVVRAAAALHERGASAQGLVLLGAIEGASGQEARDVAYWQGVLASESGALEEGIASLRRAVEQGGGARRKYSLADALSRAGRFDEAAALFIEVRGEAKDASVRDEAAFAAAFAWNRSGRPEKAIPLLRRLDGDEVARDLREDAILALGENHFALEQYEKARGWFARLSQGDRGRHVEAALYKQGWCDFKMKRWKQALASFGALLRRPGAEPHAAEVRYLVGKCHEALGDDEAARASFDDVRRLPGGDGYATAGRLGSAAAARRQGDLDAAATAYEDVLGDVADPESKGEALFGLGEVFAAQKRHEDAVGRYRRLLEELPGHARAEDARLAMGWSLHELERHEASAAAVEPLLSSEDQHRRGEALYLSALGELSRERYDRAAALLKTLREELPRHARAAEAELAAGIAAARRGRAKEAVELFEAYLGRDGALDGRDTALYELAFCHEAAENARDRDRAFERLVSQHPQSPFTPDALFRLAESAYEAGAHDRALERYRALSALDGAGELAAKARYKAAWCLRQLEAHDRAAPAFAKVAEGKGPLAAEACYLAGDEWTKAGRHEQAERAFATMAKRHARHELAPDAALRRVLSLAALDRHQDVIRSAPRALKGEPKGTWKLAVRSALGDAFFAVEQWGRARRAYRSVTDASEGELAARAQLRIGLAHAREGKIDEAIDELLKVTILYSHESWGAKASFHCAGLFEKKGQPAKARKLFEDVVERYSNQPEAAPARERLKALNGTTKKEGL